MSFILGTNVCAQENSMMISNGYTENGIYYEVYGTLPNTNLRGTIEVSREIIYNGKIKPSATITWTENIDGIKYSGTLTLKKFLYNATSNKTIATYSGILNN